MRIKAITICILMSGILFAQDLTLEAPDGTSVTIHRDEYGVPHIFAESETGVFFGQGYAVAEDRLFQLEFNRRGAEGRLSEVLGSNYLAWDRYRRTIGYTQAEKQAQFDQLSVELQELMESYSAGINAYLDVLAADPYLTPLEFALLGIDMEPWTVFSTFSVMYYMTWDFGAFGGTELDRLWELQNYGQEWFDANRPINDPSAPTTIEGGEAAVPQTWTYSGITVRNEVIEEYIAHREHLEELRESAGLPGKFGSFAVLATPEKSASGNVMLLGCPQMGTPQEDTPQINNEVELMCPTMHVGGMAIAGIPGLIIGHTEHHGWTMTSGLSDNNDIYIDSTSDATGSQYWYNDEWHDVEAITDTIQLQFGAVDIFTHYRTVHGPVMTSDLENHQLFTLKLTFWQQEYRTMEFYYINWKASSLEQFEQAAADNFVIGFNMHYADNEQNIKYWHIGLYQDRTDGVDPRLPHKGDGSEEWGGFIPFEDLPQADGTQQDYFANWNNKPVSWWNNGDNVPWIGEHHVTDIKDYVGPISQFTYDNLKDTPYNIGSHGTYQHALEFQGETVRDENIIPPGQSGFINWQGIPSPHFNDQWPLHVSWEFKDQQFGLEDAGVDQPAVLPSVMVLEQNYPNPFNPVTNIRFTIETHGFASLQVFDITGRLVTTLVDEQLPIGQHEAVWDGSDVSSGVYLIRLSFGNQPAAHLTQLTKKMVLLK